MAILPRQEPSGPQNYSIEGVRSLRNMHRTDQEQTGNTSARYRKRSEAPGLDMRDHTASDETELDLASHEVGHQRCIAAVGDGRGLESGMQAEILHGQVAGAAVSGAVSEYFPAACGSQAFTNVCSIC